MAEVTIEKLASDVGTTVDRLVQQFADAGIPKQTGQMVSEEEKKILFDTIRELMRNGFSHSDPSKILKDLPDKFKAYQSTFSNPQEIKEINLNHKVIPIFQSMQMDNFAKENAFEYFKFIFQLMKNIDNRLKAKFNIK